MARKRSPSKAPASGVTASAVAADDGKARREADRLAAASAVLCVALGFASHQALNPDGVSYLDLAAAIGAGRWDDFVQGYWSPLYPALVAIVGALTGRTAGALVPAVHILNVVIAIGAVAVLWWATRRSRSVAEVRLSFAALLLCSYRPPRVDAVTPDLLLLAIVMAITWELVQQQGRRWLLLGVLLGAAFLAKTSVWPWLLAMFVLRVWFARGTPNVRGVLLSSVIGLCMALLWVIPLSIKDGASAIRDSASLNACWYLKRCDSRTPDTHGGTHRQYRSAAMPDGSLVQWAEFASPPIDGRPTTLPTYLPWSDPAGWADGVTSQSGATPAALALVKYWATLAGYVIGLWHLPLILAVLLPALAMGWRTATWVSLRTDNRDALLAMILGVLGIGQFIAIHAEPRLTAPYALMLALATTAWLFRAAPARASGPAFLASPRFHTLASLASLLAVVPFAVKSWSDSRAVHRLIVQRAAAIDTVRRTLVPGGVPHERIVVVGHAIPVVADAYRLGGRIVAQVLPLSAPKIDSLSKAQQRQLVNQLFAGRADVAWFSSESGAFRMVPIDQPAPR